MKQVMKRSCGFLVVVELLAASSCSSRSPKMYGSGGQGALEEERAPVPEDFASSFGVMNFRQLAATYESLTGVALSNGGVLQEYEAQITSLPKSYDPAAMSAAKVSAATKLAASYCDVMSQNEDLLVERLGASGAELAALSSSEFGSTLLEGFYGPATALQGDRIADVDVLSSLITVLRGVQVNNQAAPSSAVFMGACAAVLSSAEFYIY